MSAWTVCWCERCWADELAAPWERAYDGAEANGPQVIGLSEFSGHYAAVGGTLELSLDLAANDQAGVWEVRVHELASGQHASKYFRVSK